MKQEPQKTEEDIIEESVKRAEEFEIPDNVHAEVRVELMKEFYIKELRTVIKETLAIAAQREQAVGDDSDLIIKKTIDIATQNGYALAIEHFEERVSKGQKVFDAIEGMKNVHRKRQAITTNDTEKN